MRTQLVIVLFLFCSAIQLSGQSFSKTEWDRISLGILNQNAENVKLKANAVLDSMTISALTVAYVYKDSALQASRKALEESDRVAQDFHKVASIKDQELSQAKKEIKKQRFLKWVGFSLAVVVGILAVK